MLRHYPSSVNDRKHKCIEIKIDLDKCGIRNVSLILPSLNIAFNEIYDEEKSDRVSIKSLSVEVAEANE